MKKRKRQSQGLPSLYEYFEDKIAKEAKALEADQSDKTKLKKTIKTKLIEKKQSGSCCCCQHFSKIRSAKRKIP